MISQIILKDIADITKMERKTSHLPLLSSLGAYLERKK